MKNTFVIVGRGGMLTFFYSLGGVLTQLIIFEFRGGTNNDMAVWEEYV
jgi:hypothetical protein